MSRRLLTLKSVLFSVELQRLRFTVWRAARAEGRSDSCFVSVVADGSGAIEIPPAPYQLMLGNHLARHTRRIAVAFNGALLRARDRLKRRRLRREAVAQRMETARRRCPADEDGAILGAAAMLALSIAISVPFSWGFVQEFEWPLMLSMMACLGLSLIDAAIAHLAGRLYAMLDLNEPNTPFALTAWKRKSRKVMLTLALGAALSLSGVFAIFRSGNGGPIWLWLVVGFAALLIAAWSGFVSYPASRVLVLRYLQRRLARADRRVSDAEGGLELILRHMVGCVETMRHRLLDLDHRGAVAFRRSYRRHHPRESFPPSVPDPGFVSEEEVLRQLFSPLGDLDIDVTLDADATASDDRAQRLDRRPPRRLNVGLPRTSTQTSTTNRLRGEA
ncbi:MAG TPA: hypothetical protein VID70_10635 [Solirubrobacteraceae bacterium]|jgi:hypothetical protein